MKKYNIEVKQKDKSKSRTRVKKVKLLNAKGMKLSSQMWLRRHLNDEFVQKSKIEGYLSRAAYKLIEIDKKFNIINSLSHNKNKSTSTSIVDLGCSPGSWSQVVLENKRINNLNVVGVDLIECILRNERFHFIKGNFLDLDIQQRILDKSINEISLIISDIAPNSTGHPEMDRFAMINIIESIIVFADRCLKEGGDVIFKSLSGAENDSDLMKILRIKFKTIKRFKPKASRSDSSEMYIVCLEKKNIV